MQSLVATSVCIGPVSFLFLTPKSSETALRSIPLPMDLPIEVDDQKFAPDDDEPGDEGIPRTSSEPEHHSGSEEFK